MNLGRDTEARPVDDEISLKRGLQAIRQRWFVVVPVFLVVLALGTWRTLHEPRLYRAAATVRVQQQRSMLPGMQSGYSMVDYRFDAMMAEQRVIQSAAVARVVAQREGFQLRVAQPAKVPR